MNKQDILGIFKKIWYFGPFLPLSHLFFNYFEKYFSPKLNEYIVTKRNKKIRKILSPFVSETLQEIYFSKSKNFGERKIKNLIDEDPLIGNLIINGIPPTLEPNSSYSPTLNYNINNYPIWFCWLQGENSIPPLSRLCLESIRKNANGHEVIIITNENLNKFVTLPDSIIKRYEQGNIKAAHFADMIRINILAQRGGLWLDATMLTLKPLPEDIFAGEFWSVKTKPFGHFVSQCRWSVFALAARKENILFIALSKIFEEYFKKYPVLVDYFLFDQVINLLYEESPEIRKMIDDIPYNNPEVHALSPLLDKNFNEKEWESLIKDTYLFKLSNKTYPSTFQFSPNSYFFHIQDIFLKNNFK